jgi:hypothetical protein
MKKRTQDCSIFNCSNCDQIVGNKKTIGINRIRFNIYVVIPSEENGSIDF